MKHSQQGFKIAETVIIMVAVVLIVAMGYFAYTNMIKEPDVGNHDGMFATTAMPPLIRGIAGAKSSAPEKFQEASGLMDALKKNADNNPCQPTEGRFKQIVLGVTADKTQALIGNSCGSTGVQRSFMLKEAGEWKMVGNWKAGGDDVFNVLTDTPNCEVVDVLNIQKSIAPVCFETQEGQSELFAGDLAGYRYVVR